MAYNVFQDGTQLFGIPASPVSINSVTYIAEDVSINHPMQVVEIKDANGIPIGQTLIPGNPTGTCKLQFATSSTPIPPRGQTFTLAGVTWWVTTVGEKYTQGAYAYTDIGFVLKIN
jgi:hypothetical protein